MNKSIDPALMQAAEAAGSTLPASMAAYCMPWLLVSRRGAFLNWRLAVKGIQ